MATESTRIKVQCDVQQASGSLAIIRGQNTGFISLTGWGELPLEEECGLDLWKVPIHMTTSLCPELLIRWWWCVCVWGGGGGGGGVWVKFFFNVKYFV